MSAPPRLSEEALLSILAATSLRAGEAVRVIDRASAVLSAERGSPLSMAEQGRLAENVQALLQAELEAGDAAVFAAQGASRAEVEEALEWFSRPGGVGRSRKVVDAASAVRKQLGRHLLTKRRILAALRDMFLHSCASAGAIADKVVAAAEAGGDVMRIMQTEPMEIANAFLQARVGCGMQELIQRAQIMAATTDDEAYLAQIEQLMENGQRAVQQALQANPQMAEMFGGR